MLLTYLIDIDDILPLFQGRTRLAIATRDGTDGSNCALGGTHTPDVKCHQALLHGCRNLSPRIPFEIITTSMETC